MLDKYGSQTELQETHHYETKEVRDSSNRLIMKGGLVVGEEFQFEYNVPVGVASTGNIYNAPTTIQGESARGLVSNYQYEVKKNDEIDSELYSIYDVTYTHQKLQKNRDV